ncbi:MAG: hypothetical protein CVU43_22130 [Chloroflexi bacterium HGW-Chloroflexi-5]|nr:MAG: hypothetical protein CVU87_09445 [Firmicutes bacterium HGW-Firmicutes-12]PKN96165.1 MAG: hypothetical protein CVU43_22130 [Chloroflexi bacterium HGW-Chloroflexi-5]
MSQKKLQKLAYYSVAWHYALFDKPFAGVDLPFEAWVHGPVSRNLYSKYKGFKFNNIPKIKTEPDFSKYKNDELEILDFVWENYGEFTANQLETLTHTEDPWQKKRRGYGELESSSEVIGVEDMKKYYRKFIKNDGEIN